MRHESNTALTGTVPRVPAHPDPPDAVGRGVPIGEGVPFAAARCSMATRLRSCNGERRSIEAQHRCALGCRHLCPRTSTALELPLPSKFSSPVRHIVWYQLAIQLGSADWCCDADAEGATDAAWLRALVAPLRALVAALNPLSEVIIVVGLVCCSISSTSCSCAFSSSCRSTSNSRRRSAELEMDTARIEGTLVAPLLLLLT